MNWEDVAKIIITLIIAGIISLVFKIIWDWLIKKNGKNGSFRVADCIEKHLDVDKRLSKGAEAFATIKEQVKQLQYRFNKQESYLEKNFDEAWGRIRELEKQLPRK